MNILIDNYLNKEDSQCLYLYHAIKSLDENQVKAFYWPSRDISTYDIFDDTKPDIFISHCGAMDYELGVYLEDNKEIADNLIIVMSTFGGGEQTKEYYQRMDTMLKSKRIGNVYLMSSKDLELKRLKGIKINHCVDDNVKPDKLNYQIPCAYFVNNQDDVTGEDDSSYHYISNTISGVDICLEEIKLAKLYNNYNKIVFKNLNKFNQCFFDALYQCKEVSYTSDDKNVDNICNSLFGQVLNVNNKDIDYKKVRQRVKEKHMPYNRVKTLLSQLPINHNLFSKR